jgi:hypothetical protein
MDIDHIQSGVSYHQSATDQKKKEWAKEKNISSRNILIMKNK